MPPSAPDRAGVGAVGGRGLGVGLGGEVFAVLAVKLSQAGQSRMA